MLRYSNVVFLERCFCCSDGSISCYEADSGQCIGRLLQCHASDIHAVDFHVGSVVVSGSRDATIKVPIISSFLLRRTLSTDTSVHTFFKLSRFIPTFVLVFHKTSLVIPTFILLFNI